MVSLNVFILSERFVFIFLSNQDDLEKVIKELEEADRKKNAIVEELLKEGPSRRANFSFCSHSDKDELILFGGEYFNGSKVISEKKSYHST